MLTHPTSDQLRILRLEGMIDALEGQRRDPHIIDLDFEERLALWVRIRPGKHACSGGRRGD